MTPDEAKNILIKELHWPKDIVELGVRAKFCCEYCGKDLIESVDAYDMWQIDHIVPNGNNDLSNLAIACKTCNFIKRHTDPLDRANGSDRESLIKIAKSIIDERRKDKQIILDRTKEAAEVLRNECA